MTEAHILNAILIRNPEMNNDAVRTEITVMSLSQVKSYCRERHEKDSIIISIGSPFEQPANIYRNSGSNVRFILRVLFEDEDAGPSVMSAEQADHIRDVVNLWYGKVGRIIVQCEAGVSRSAGVAAAILKAKTGDDMSVFGNPFYKPNMHCYRTMLNSFISIEKR